MSKYVVCRSSNLTQNQIKSKSGNDVCQSPSALRKCHAHRPREQDKEINFQKQSKEKGQEK